MKKTIVTGLIMTCLSMMLMTGCGNKNNSATQSAEPTSNSTATEEPVLQTDEPASGGAIGEIGDDIEDGADDVGDGVEDAVDDAGDAVDDATKDR